MKLIKVDPVGKPRMTQKDRWAKRPCVQRYWGFKDSVLEQWGDNDFPLNDSHITFVIKMPKSWSKKKKTEMRGQPHQQKPDIDNLTKALFDAILPEDSAVWDHRSTKVWGDEGLITIIY